MITASIVLYHTSLKDLGRLLRCVADSPVDCLYLVDNSADRSLESHCTGSDRNVYIYNNANLGYGAGHNVAVRRALDAGADYHVVLNPDIYWQDDLIGAMAGYMDANRDTGLVMPRILYPDGRVQQLCKLLPTPLDLFGRRFIPSAAVRDRIDRRYELHDFGYDSVMEVPSLSGCFMFMRCSVLREVGIFDERYFMYAEDLDLCRRIGTVSRTMFVPHVSLYHEYEKGSYHNSRLLRFHISSLVKYFNKWGWFIDGERRRRNRLCLDRIRKADGDSK